jgi:hypothetical protein
MLLVFRSQRQKEKIEACEFACLRPSLPLAMWRLGECVLLRRRSHEVSVIFKTGYLYFKVGEGVNY